MASYPAHTAESPTSPRDGLRQPRMSRMFAYLKAGNYARTIISTG
jgi:hypothetical protein